MFYQRTTGVPDLSLEPSGCQDLSTFPQTWLTSPLRLPLRGVWRSEQLRQPFSKNFDSILFQGTKVGYESWEITWAVSDLTLDGCNQKKKKEKKCHYGCLLWRRCNRVLPPVRRAKVTLNLLSTRIILFQVSALIMFSAAVIRFALSCWRSRIFFWFRSKTSSSSADFSL